MQAHNNGIAAIAVSNDGKMLATASTNGTLIRIFSPETGQQLGELRRGSTPTQICDLTFDLEGKYLCCASNKGTIHIFKVAHL